MSLLLWTLSSLLSWLGLGPVEGEKPTPAGRPVTVAPADRPAPTTQPVARPADKPVTQPADPFAQMQANHARQLRQARQMAQDPNWVGQPMDPARDLPALTAADLPPVPALGKSASVAWATRDSLQVTVSPDGSVTVEQLVGDVSSTRRFASMAQLRKQDPSLCKRCEALLPKP